jgi:hypothetical protein
MGVGMTYPKRFLSGRTRITLPFLLAGALLFPASAALASHARPLAATPSTIRLVPAYDQCIHDPGTSPANGTHVWGGFPSCVDTTSGQIARQTSDFLTFLAPDRPPPYNSPANGSGVVTEQVTCLVPGTTTSAGKPLPCGGGPDEEDISVTVDIKQVRCLARPTVSGFCAGGAASLYNGKVQVRRDLKVTDHSNALNPNPGTGCSQNNQCTGTMITLPMQWAVQCVSGSCSVVTSDDVTSQIPNFITEQKRMSIAESRLWVEDAGADGDLEDIPGPPACPPNCAQQVNDGYKTFLEEGVFAP